jgi:hypothetical protein
LLAWCVLVGVALYVCIDIALHFLRPDLSLLHNAESDYGNGPHAWLMDINFEVRMLLSLACVGLAWRDTGRSVAGRVGCVLLAVWAISSGILGFFRDDPLGTAPTAHGAVHLVSAGIGFIAALIGLLCLTIAYWPPASRSPRWALLIVWIVALLALLALGHAGFRPHSPGGLYERIFLAAVLAWMAVLGAWRMLSGAASSRVTLEAHAGG